MTVRQPAACSDGKVPMADQWEVQHEQDLHHQRRQKSHLFQDPFSENHFSGWLRAKTQPADLPAFARWLRKNVREEDLKPEIVIYGFLNRYEHDLRNDRVRLLRLIKETKEEDLYRELAYAEKYVGFHREPSRKSREYWFEIPVYYEEDLYQLFRINGATEEQAFEWTRAACSGSFKAYCRSLPKKDPVFMLPEELLSFAKTADGLPDRNWICRTFKHEYPLFLKYLEQYEKHD